VVLYKLFLAEESDKLAPLWWSRCGIKWFETRLARDGWKVAADVPRREKPVEHAGEHPKKI